MRVLVVDDDIATVDVIKYTIHWERLGITEVFTAYYIENAKVILREHNIDIIISDIEMPQGSGLDLLSWFREQNMSGEFLLLTCHESFDYAMNAVNLHAAEYLMKPFDGVVMEAALKKIILKLKEERLLKENSEFGKWVKKNKKQLRVTFWNMILDGHMSKSPEKIKEEISNRDLDENPDADFHLVVSKVTDIERDRERINPNLALFIMENIHSEILCGNPENASVVSYDYNEYYVLVTICPRVAVKQVEENCKALVQEFKKIFFSMITCCISEPCKISDFYDVFHRNLELISSNVVYYGTYFREIQGIEDKVQDKFFLEFELMEEMLNQKKKMDFLSYLKERLNDRINEKSLNGQMLQQAKQEILQVVHAYLAKRGISASGLFIDEVSKNLVQKSSLSAINMVRWVNYLIECTFEYENEIQKSHTIIDKINQYVKEHYQEDIDRRVIAAEFFLAPEYLSKMYKKQTGKSLTDYIGEYRIEQAKILLKKGELRIGDVSEAVGFKNFTYFSTMFKKYTGVSPNQYRRD